MKIRLAAPIQTDSIVDGEGIRTVIWTQGCTHNCKGCHNPETHDISKGILVDIEEIKDFIKSVEFHDGITLSGGDPFMQPEECYNIALFCKKLNLNVWCYTGYTFEQLKIISKNNIYIKKLLENIDVLIDGKFILEEKSLNTKFRGSKNQRIIDVKNSLLKNEVILIKKYEEKEEFAFNNKYLFV